MHWEQMGSEVWMSSERLMYPAGKYTCKVDNRNTRARCEICLKLTIKRRFGVFIVNFERISHLVQEFLLLTLSS